MLNEDYVEQRYDFVKKLSDYPKDLFSDSFIETINETKKLFKEGVEYTDKSLVKCCVVGNTSTGKSTLINALLKKDILYEGGSKGTLCAAKCQSSSNNEEYYIMYEGNECLDKQLSISGIKKINFTNPDYSNFSMNSNNYLDVYLNVSNHEILQNFVLIDCPGFDDNNLEEISKYCKCADMLVFCYKAESGITDNDIKKINIIKKNIGKFQISFIINRCDKCDLIDRKEIKDKLSPYLTEKDAIFFISDIKAKERNLSDAINEEFDRFEKCLQKQKSQASVTYQKVYLELICSVKKWSNFLICGTIRNDLFSEEIFAELQQEITTLINSNTKVYYKDDSNIALMEYSTLANKEISKFLVKQFVNDHHLNERVINDNYFYKRFIENDKIKKPLFRWFNLFNQNDKMKLSFVDYFTSNSTVIKKNIDIYYKERVEKCIEKLGTYKTELQNIRNNINALVMD